MKKCLRWYDVPIQLCVCVFSIGLLLCSSVVAKSATVEKASAGQSSFEVNHAACQAPVFLPDIVVAPSTAIISSIQKDLLTQKTSATTSPPVVQDFECAITKVCAAPKYGLVVTHQPVLSVVRT